MTDNEKQDLMKVIKEISNSFTRSEAERDYVKEAIADLSDKYDVDKRTLRTVAKIYHKQNMVEVATQQSDVEDLYESLTSKA